MIKSLLNKRIILRVLLVLIALAIGIISALELRDYMARNTPHEKVLVAKADIMPYAVIRSEYLTYKQMPVGSRIPGSLQDPRQVVGKRTLATIYKGEQILPQKLAESPLVLSANERAVAIPVDTVRAVGMNIKPGDKVDVYWIPKAKQEFINTKNETEIREASKIASDSTVLDVLNKENASVFNNFLSENAGQNKTNKSSAPSVVVIKVKNSEVKNVLTAVGNGTVYLAKKQ